MGGHRRALDPERVRFLQRGQSSYFAQHLTTLIATRKWKAIGGPFFPIVNHAVELSPVFGPMVAVG